MFVYAIISPLTGNPVYIGRTTNPIKKRLSQHVQEAKAGVMSARPISLWIRSMIYLGVSSEIKIIPLAECKTIDALKAKEDKVIGEYMGKHNLLNITRAYGGKRPRFRGGIIGEIIKI